MNRFLKTFAGLTALSLAACSGETVDYTGPQICPAITDNLPVVDPPAVASAPLTTVSKKSVENSNAFAMKFYLANSKECHDNICVSPFSVSTVLAMIANGSSGIGRDEILSALGFEASDAGLTSLNTHYQTLLSNLPNIEEEITCNFINTLWSDPMQHQVHEPFMQTLHEHYYAHKVDIAPGGTSGMDAINHFVSHNTNGLIDKFLTCPLDVELAFLNTSYFKAGWSEPFLKNMTTKGIFLDIDYKEQETDFMVNNALMGYVRTDDGSEAVRLDYGEKRQFSMTFILPTTQINHVALDEVLTADNIRQINNDMIYVYMFLKLPKFELEFNNPNTMKILRNIGLEQVCSGNVFFDKISDAPFALNCFIHATKLKVDEEGSEGAAVSLGGMETTVRPDPEKPHEIVFDRPFIFYIQENTTGTILFIGSVKTFS